MAVHTSSSYEALNSEPIGGAFRMIEVITITLQTMYEIDVGEQKTCDSIFQLQLFKRKITKVFFVVVLTLMY